MASPRGVTRRALSESAYPATLRGMPLSEMPPPLASQSNQIAGQQLAQMRTEAPGPMSRGWAARLAKCECQCVFQAPGPIRSDGVNRSDSALFDESDHAQHAVPIVYTSALGSNVVDADGNMYVDMAASFGALLLGHVPHRVEKAMEIQADRTWTGLGDLYPADAKIALLEQVVALYPGPSRALLGLSGSDAVTCALKTAMLYTQKPGVIAFEGAYHGMGYAPLAACGYNERFRSPFAPQLNEHVHFASYPRGDTELDQTLAEVKQILASGDIGAVIVEPVLGRGGCIVPPAGFLPQLQRLAHEAGALVIADEIWTGLGRTGQMLESVARGIKPDLVCLGKGLGGGLALSACVGAERVMDAWARCPGVVHTCTLQGHALACATGVATLHALRAMKLDERAARVGEAFKKWLELAVEPCAQCKGVTGKGLMVGVALDSGKTAAKTAMMLLQKGFIVVTGGAEGNVLTLTPALNIDENLLESFVDALADVLRAQ